jgi:hypothetical protein
MSDYPGYLFGALPNPDLAVRNEPIPLFFFSFRWVNDSYIPHLLRVLRFIQIFLFLHPLYNQDSANC